MIWTPDKQLRKGSLRAESCEFRGASARVTLHEQSDARFTDALTTVLSVDHEEANIIHQIPDVSLSHAEDTFDNVKRRLEQVMGILPDKDDLEAEAKLEHFVDEVLNLQYS